MPLNRAIVNGSFANSITFLGLGLGGYGSGSEESEASDAEEEEEKQDSEEELLVCKHSVAHFFEKKKRY